LRRTFFDFAVTLVCLSLLGFLGYHGYYGERSLDKSEALERRVETLAETLQSIRKEREAMEAHVRLLRPESVDPDVIGELARKSLGFSREGEIVLTLSR
jgi:cell division protein FtsB